MRSFVYLLALWMAVLTINAEPVVVNFGAIAPEKVVFEKKKLVLHPKIDRTSPLLEIENEKVETLVYELPVFKKEYILTVIGGNANSRPNFGFKRTNLRSGTIIHPKMILLNEKKEIIFETMPSDFEYMGSFGASFQYDYLINNSEARYLLVTPDMEMVGGAKFSSNCLLGEVVKARFLWANKWVVDKHGYIDIFFDEASEKDIQKYKKNIEEKRIALEKEKQLLAEKSLPEPTLLLDPYNLYNKELKDYSMILSTENHVLVLSINQMGSVDKFWRAGTVLLVPPGTSVISAKYFYNPVHTGSFYESKRFNKDFKFDAGKVYAIKGAFIQAGEKIEKTFDVELIKEGNTEADRIIQNIKDFVKHYDPAKDTNEVKKWRSYVSNILKRGTENNVKKSPLGNDKSSGALEGLSSENPMRIRDQVRRLRTERNYKSEYLSECIRILEKYLANPDKSKMALDMISWVAIYLGEARCKEALPVLKLITESNLSGKVKKHAKNALKLIGG